MSSGRIELKRSTVLGRKNISGWLDSDVHGGSTARAGAASFGLECAGREKQNGHAGKANESRTRATEPRVVRYMIQLRFCIVGWPWGC